MRVLTWNVGRVHLGPWAGRASRASDRDLGRVARGITVAGADVAALQELVGAAQLDALLARLGPSWAGAIGEPELFDRHTAIVARREHLERFATVRTASGRAAAAVWWAGAVVASVHLDAFEPDVRLAQARDLVAWAVARPEPHVVLAGDLNFDLGYLDHPGDLAAASLLADRFVDVGHAAGPTALLGRRLDHLLARRPAAPASDIWRFTRLRLPLGDHLPLAASFRLAPSAAPPYSPPVVEKRTHARHAHRLPIEFTVEGAAGPPGRGVTRDLALGGVFVETSAQAATGTRLRLRFSVPTQPEPIEVGGEVRWAITTGFGVRFDGLSARDTWALGKLLERRGAL